MVEEVKMLADKDNPPTINPTGPTFSSRDRNSGYKHCGCGRPISKNKDFCFSCLQTAQTLSEDLDKQAEVQSKIEEYVESEKEVQTRILEAGSSEPAVVLAQTSEMLIQSLVEKYQIKTGLIKTRPIRSIKKAMEDGTITKEVGEHLLSTLA